jgi:hypothetical protein
VSRVGQYKRSVNQLIQRYTDQEMRKISRFGTNCAMLFIVISAGLALYIRDVAIIQSIVDKPVRCNTANSMH